MLINGTDNNNMLGKTALGADKMVGKKGNDSYYVNHIGDKVVEEVNAGIDRVSSSINYQLGDNVENLILTGIAGLNGIGNALDNVLIGNTGNNLLKGMVGNDKLYGNAGDDILDGGDGDDFLTGGTGEDRLSGGNGNDLYSVDAATDEIIELADQGIDKVASTAQHYTLSDNIENLVLRQGALDGTGNSLNNLIVGNAANNTINGGYGNDNIYGGAGDDTLNGGDGNDVLHAGDGADILSGGLGKDTYLLAETSHSVDTVVVGLDPTFEPDTYKASTDVVKGFVLGEDKLDVVFNNIVADVATLTPGNTPDNFDFGVFTQHTVSNGIYTLYDKDGHAVDITPQNEKAAYTYFFVNMPANVNVAGFHVIQPDDRVDTVVVQHDHTYVGNAVMRNHIFVDLIGVDASLTSDAANTGSILVF